MNDNTKVLDQNPVSGNQVQPSAQVGVANKEIGPILPVIPEIMPAGPEVEHGISQELKDIGVEAREDKPDLTQVVDVHHAGPSVPVPPGHSGKVIMPMSEDEVTDKLKTGQDDDSGKWLSKLIQKIMKVMGLKVMGL